MTHDDSSDGIDRRTFLGGAAGVGAAAGLPGLPGDGGDGFEAPAGEVPYVAARRHTNHAAVAAGDEPPRREPVWASMRVDRWLRIEAANAAERRVNAMLRERGASDLVRAGTRLNGNGELIVDVHVVELETPRGDVLTPDVDVDRLRAALPSTARGRGELPGEHRGGLGSLGTPTREREHEVAWTRVRQAQQAGYFDHEYRPVPGGSEMAAEDQGFATTCTPAWDRGLGEYVMVTAGHAVEDVTSGQPCWQPAHRSWGNRIGYSANAEFVDRDPDGDGYIETTFDAATIRMSGAGVAYELAGDDGDDDHYDGVYGIGGPLGWREIEYDRFDGKKYFLQGVSSGRKGEEIWWTSDSYKLFKTDIDAIGGDSGGPHFKEKSGFAYIAGVHHGSNSKYNYSEATAMEAVENRFPITV